MSEDHIMLKNVRCSFPHLFKFPEINGDIGSCGIILLIEREDPRLIALRADIEALSVSKHKIVLPDDKLCLREGKHKRAEYGDLMAISTNSKKGEYPRVVGPGRTVITDASQCAIYPGCRVHAKFSLWAQNNSWGRRINAELIAVQFAGDDEPLSDTYVSEEDALAGFGDDGDDFVNAGTSGAAEAAFDL
mgnify:CR=1 FL=1